ncbi:MAG: adenylate/guanylate cyclase domain-containing protein [Ardenticatenaceae bacterium]|nr:adenylate/guanylate cyclase domain-containing protein [Ardenticatenaceae bacterium]
MTLSTYLPQDRIQALAHNTPLPDRTIGSALFADISGFTPLTETLHHSLGPHRGAEELTHDLDLVYTTLIAEVEKQGGSVIGFAGDSITFQHITLPHSSTPALALKVSVATGPARRFIVGDPHIHYVDTLAGATITRMASGERLAQKGEIVVDEATAVALSSHLTIQEWRMDAANNGRSHPTRQYNIPNRLAGRCPVVFGRSGGFGPGRVWLAICSCLATTVSLIYAKFNWAANRLLPN